MNQSRTGCEGRWRFPGQEDSASLTATGIMLVVSMEKRLFSMTHSSISPGLPFSISRIVFSTWGATFASEPAACHIIIKVLQTPHSPSQNHKCFISNLILWLESGTLPWSYSSLEQKRPCRQVQNKVRFPFPNDPIASLILENGGSISVIKIQPAGPPVHFQLLFK